MATVFIDGDTFPYEKSFAAWDRWVANPKNWRRVKPKRPWNHHWTDQLEIGVSMHDNGFQMVAYSKDEFGRMIIGSSEVYPYTTMWTSFDIPLFDNYVKGEVKVTNPNNVNSEATTAQNPEPRGDGFPIVLEVLKDITERVKVGIERYGEPLKPNNGRSALTDAYQEAIDLVMYLRQELSERNSREETIRILTAELNRSDMQNVELRNAVTQIKMRSESLERQVEIAVEAANKEKRNADGLAQQVSNLLVRGPKLSDRYKQIIHHMLRRYDPANWAGPNTRVPEPTAFEVEELFRNLDIGKYAPAQDC